MEKGTSFATKPMHTIAAPGNQVRKCPFRSQNIVLKNWENGSAFVDKLHKKAVGTPGCDGQGCLGSMMRAQGLCNDPRKDIRSEQEKIDVATDFIKEYYESLKSTGSQAERQRITEVVNSIRRTGSYHLTESELAFGAKTSWRNAPRCIGRFQWNNLQVFDCRNVTTCREMFDAMCLHLDYASNGGNIRSAVTIFPQRTTTDKDFRVWNSQIIRYAGYRQPDGSIIGDPVNVEFTEVCMKLGWKPKGGRFDVLPLVLQANGEDPNFFDIPERFVLEVELCHPTFKWFKELGFKWYGVPGVSNMLIDIGGVEFPAAPFSGWFMSSEIARDLCDTARYNILKDVAIKMKLDVQNPSSLWRDIAFVEVNLAVLYSYQAARVTIANHHAAAESFMKHIATEMKIRGGCPGDWVWLTPPVSGSLSPVFHQEILNYALNPAILYQIDSWNTHAWKSEKMKKVMKKKKIRFDKLAKLILGFSSMMRGVMAKRVKATILYATETGKALEFAQTLGKVFNNSFSARVICMEDYNDEELEDETLLLVVTSTFGNGDAPENGAELLRKLQRRTSKPEYGGDARSKRQSVHASTHFKFSVFGLGSTAYPHFCAFAHTLDGLLEKLNGERIVETYEGDELGGQDDSFRLWTKKVFQESCSKFGVTMPTKLQGVVLEQDKGWSPERYRVIQHANGKKRPDVLEGMEKFHKKKLSLCKLAKRTSLLQGIKDRSTILVELNCPNADEMEYKPGDHVGIFPRNDKDIVKRILSRVSRKQPSNVAVVLQELSGSSSGSDWISSTRLPPCSLKVALERYLDITTPPNQKLLQYFSACARDAKEKRKLKKLSSEKTAYENWRAVYFPNLAEVLEEFSSIKVAASLLLSQLPPMKCRYYSISSSPSVHSGQVHCTVAVVTYRTKGGKGPVHHGVCSTYLNELKTGSDLICYIRPAKEFRLPESPKPPVLLIAAGTGIAPFRSFWEQRKHEISHGKTFGKMALVFGCRFSDKDQLYKDEVKKAKKCGAITHYRAAFSRMPGTPKQYVQHVLKSEFAKMVRSWILQKNCHIYICGDVAMADEVKIAIVEILSQTEGFSSSDAEKAMSELMLKGRLHEDIFGANHNFAPTKQMK